MGLSLSFVRTFLTRALTRAIQDQTSKMKTCWVSDKGMQKAVYLIKREKKIPKVIFLNQNLKKKIYLEELCSIELVSIKHDNDSDSNYQHTLFPYK